MKDGFSEQKSHRLLSCSHLSMSSLPPSIFHFFVFISLCLSSHKEDQHLAMGTVEGGKVCEKKMKGLDIVFGSSSKGRGGTRQDEDGVDKNKESESGVTIVSFI